jgi:hypothetical protein
MLLTKYTDKTYISAGVVSPPKLTLPRQNTGRKPRQPYAGSKLARQTKVTMIRRLVQPKRRWRRGQTREPAMPAIGLMIPMMIRDVAGILSEVFANNIAVLVMVVKPVEIVSVSISLGEE